MLQDPAVRLRGSVVVADREQRLGEQVSRLEMLCGREPGPGESALQSADRLLVVGPRRAGLGARRRLFRREVTVAERQRVLHRGAILESWVLSQQLLVARDDDRVEPPVEAEVDLEELLTGRVRAVAGSLVLAGRLVLALRGRAVEGGEDDGADAEEGPEMEASDPRVAATLYSHVPATLSG